MYFINPLCDGKNNIDLDTDGKKYFPHLYKEESGNVTFSDFYIEKRNEDFYIETTLDRDVLVSAISDAIEHHSYVEIKAPENTGEKKPEQLSMLGAESLSPKEKRIKEILQKGSLMQNGKLRIYDACLYGNPKNFANFLKEEYGLGGSYNSGVNFESNAKGLRIEVRGQENPEEHFETLLTWNNVATRINELVNTGEYLTEKEENELTDFYAERKRREEQKLAIISNAETQNNAEQIQKTKPKIELIEIDKLPYGLDEELNTILERPKYSWQNANEFGKHYFEIEQKYPNSIVIQRLGDFYEIMGENANVSSTALDLTLTGRDIGLPERVPMVGFPYHCADKYIDKLNEKFNVVIDENNGKDPEFRPIKNNLANNDAKTEFYGLVYDWKGLKEENYLYTASQLEKLDQSFVAGADVYDGAFSSNKTYTAYRLSKDNDVATETSIKEFLTGGYNNVQDEIDGWYWETKREDLFTGGDNPTAIEWIDKLNLSDVELSSPEAELPEDYPYDLPKGYHKVASKVVYDANDFTSVYSWWKNDATEHSVFYFDDGQDWEADSDKEAQEWFDNYKGFEEEKEHLQDGNLKTQGENPMEQAGFIQSQIDESKDKNARLDAFIEEKLKEIKWLDGRMSNFTEDELQDIANDLKVDFENSEFAEKEFFDDWYDEFMEEILVPKLTEKYGQKDVSNEDKKNQLIERVNTEFNEYRSETLKLSKEEVFELSYKTYVLTEIYNALNGEYSFDNQYLVDEEDVDTLLNVDGNLLESIYQDYIFQDHSSVHTISDTVQLITDFCETQRDLQEQRYLNDNDLEKQAIDRDAELSIARAEQDDMVEFFGKDEEDTAYYFFKDKLSLWYENNRGLEQADEYIIVAPVCYLSQEDLEEHNVTFLKLGRDIDESDLMLGDDKARFSMKASYNKKLPLEATMINRACALDIEKGIAENYKDNLLSVTFMDDLYSLYGAERIKYVLANTIQEKIKDESFATSNKEWLKDVAVNSSAEDRKKFLINSNPAVLDMAISYCQKHEKENLFMEETEHKKEWLKVTVSSDALISKYDKNSLLRMPTNGEYRGYSYYVYNNRIKESTLLVDLQSDGRERAYTFVVGENETITIKNRKGEKIELSGKDFQNLVDQTSSQSYVFEKQKNNENISNEKTNDYVRQNEQNKGENIMNNSLILQGQLAEKPQIKTSAKGVKYCHVALEVENVRTSKRQVFDVALFNKGAEQVENLDKGAFVEIKGRMQFGQNKKTELIGLQVANADEGYKNSFALAGFVKNKEVALKETANGNQYLNLALSLQNDYNNQYDTLFVSGFDKIAERMSVYKNKDLINVAGNVQSDNGKINLVVTRSELIRSASEVKSTDQRQVKENDVVNN